MRAGDNGVRVAVPGVPNRTAAVRPPARCERRTLFGDGCDSELGPDLPGEGGRSDRAGRPEEELGTRPTALSRLRPAREGTVLQWSEE